MGRYWKKLTTTAGETRVEVPLYGRCFAVFLIVQSWNGAWDWPTDVCALQSDDKIMFVDSGCWILESLCLSKVVWRKAESLFDHYVIERERLEHCDPPAPLRGEIISCLCLWRVAFVSANSVCNVLALNSCASEALRMCSITRLTSSFSSTMKKNICLLQPLVKTRPGFLDKSNCSYIDILKI